MPRPLKMPQGANIDIFILKTVNIKSLKAGTLTEAGETL